MNGNTMLGERITAAEFAARFENPTPKGNGFDVRCPCHDDNCNSLSINPGDDGRILVHCHAGCGTSDIVTAVGLKMSDLMPTQNSNGRPHIEATYNYCDSNNKMLYQLVRFDPKGFRQRCPDSNGGWQWKLNGVERVLYRLPELLAADSTKPVFIVEGEKDVDRLVLQGLVATCNVGGAGKWKSHYNKALHGKNVVMLPDNDDPGRKHAIDVANELHGIAASVRIVELPGLPPKGDVSDWIEAGGTANELMDIARTTPKHESELANPDRPTSTHVSITNANAKGEGDDKKITPLPMEEVLGLIKSGTDGWPRCVDGSLFIHDQHGISWLAETSALFGFLSSKCGQVFWRNVSGCVTKSEVFHELRRTARSYVAVENFPHEPEIPDHYYACKKIQPGDGSRLRELLDRYEPDTDIDRDLIQAMMMTMLWGGLPGTRPCFVITADTGRGAGKTKCIETIAHIFGGVLSFSQKEEIGKIKTRLLTPDALVKRAALLDNVKSARFSWGELEALITATSIGGHRMYAGEGSRPNTLTWFITLNGASLSTDMAQRSVIVKLRKPKRSGAWEESIISFIDKYRTDIIADLIACLRVEPQQLDSFSRWATWEKNVLARLPEPVEAQKVIRERQGTVDAEREEADVLEDYFASQLKMRGYVPAKDDVFIPSQLAVSWYNRALNQRDGVIGASRAINQLCTEGRTETITKNKCNSWGRGYVWRGQKAGPNTTVYLDLEDRERQLNRESNL